MFEREKHTFGKVRRMADAMCERRNREAGEKKREKDPLPVCAGNADAPRGKDTGGKEMRMDEKYPGA